MLTFVYVADESRFRMLDMEAGTAARYNVGAGNGNLALLGTNGAFPSPRLGTGGSADRILTWGATTPTWQDPPRDAGRFFAIPGSGVGGTADAIELTTGESITLTYGDRFFFRPTAVNTGDITISVDGSAAQLVAQRYQGSSSDSQLAPGTLQVSGHYTFLFMDATEAGGGGFDRFVLMAPQQFVSASSLASGPAAGNVLGFDGSDMQWITPGSGSGGGGRFFPHSRVERGRDSGRHRVDDGPFDHGPERRPLHVRAVGGKHGRDHHQRGRQSSAFGLYKLEGYNRLDTALGRG